MLGCPERFETSLLQCAGEFARRHRIVGEEHRSADVHGWLPPVGCREPIDAAMQWLLLRRRVPCARFGPGTAATLRLCCQVARVEVRFTVPRAAALRFRAYGQIEPHIYRVVR